jgi:hypothetical protein
MKSAAYILPYDSLFNFLHDYLRRKGCTIVSSNMNDGTIKAQSEKALFQKHRTLDLTVKKLSEHTTSVTLSVNSNPHIYKNPKTEDEFEEEKLIETINHFF